MRRRAGADGFTLVEVLVAMTIAATTALGVAAAFAAAARGYDVTTDGVASAASSSLLVVRLPTDALGADDAVASATGEGITCTGADDPRLQLVGEEGLDVVYGVGRAGDDWVLQRHDCAGGAVSSTIVVARGLGGPDGVVVERIPEVGQLRAVSLSLPGTGVTVVGASRIS